MSKRQAEIQLRLRGAEGGGPHLEVGEEEDVLAELLGILARGPLLHSEWEPISTIRDIRTVN